MNEMRAANAYALQKENAKRPECMVKLSPSEMPVKHEDPAFTEAWRSRYFLAQVFNDATGKRISINRTSVDRRNGRWTDDITCDELMLIKRQIGFGDCWAYECYPAERCVVNVANMRHLWIPNEQPSFGWKREA